MNFVLPSTFMLTLLMLVGLFFFVRASVKDRTQSVTWQLTQPTQQVLNTVTTYLENRAYVLKTIDRETERVIFAGVVEASLGLTIFLALLVGIGGLCLGLVLAVQFPQVAAFSWVGLLLAPLAGWFYQAKARRTEQVVLHIAADSFGQTTSEPTSEPTTPVTALTVTGHREELRTMQATLKFPPSSSLDGYAAANVG